MEPKIEAISGEEIQNEIERLQTLERRIGWVRGVTLLGALICSFWLIYRAFAAHGLWIALLFFVGLALVYKFGASPMFAVAASALCFGYHAVGVWLPLVSYVLAAISLYVDLRCEKLHRRVDPFNLGSF
jgi:hypothetical protein